VSWPDFKSFIFACRKYPFHRRSFPAFARDRSIPSCSGRSEEGEGNMSQVSQEVGALLAPMIKRPFWVVLNSRKATSSEMEPYVAEHLQYMNGLEEQGLLWGSGPFIEPGVVVGDGLTIFNVAEEADVHKLMAEEPLVKRGLRSYSVRKWELREGKISIDLFLSQSRFGL
jgi:uncharacterized protein